MTSTPTLSDEVHVLYGSETGNAEFLCDDLVDALTARSIPSASAPLDDIAPADLPALGTALIIVSTTGDGDMPYGADGFWERIDADDAPTCEGLRYAVLALGDRTYTYFCEAGTLIDRRLAQLGATRIADRVDCDAAYDARARAWIDERVAQLQSEATPTDAQPAADACGDGTTVTECTAADDRANGADATGSGRAAAGGWDPDDWGADVAVGIPTATPTVFGGSAATRSPWTRERPFTARIADVRRLSGADGGREVLHCELDLGASGIVLQPGDSLAVVARNDPFAVDRFLAAAGMTGRETVDGRPLDAMARDGWELRFASLPLLRAVAAHAPRTPIGMLVAADDRTGLDEWVRGHTVADALALLPAPWSPATLAQLMQPVRSRAYSVACAPRARPGFAHLTVAVERPMTSTMRSGVASGFLADRVGVGDGVPVFPQPNRSFRLPDDAATPIIMIGPGVGVAPFRAFLQDRSQHPDPGPAWLFFGNRHGDDGFLYRDDWLGFREAGVLTRLDTAFSRDGAQRVHVQDRLRQHGAELVQWLQNGAYVYVCGDARHMAPDVDDALREIVTARLGAIAGTALLTRLHDERRYRVDAY